MWRWSLWALLLLWPETVAQGQEKFPILIQPSTHAHKDVPICVPLSLPREKAGHKTAEVTGPGLSLQGQLTAPGIMTESIKAAGPDLVRRDLHFILPALKAGQALKLQVQTLPTPRFATVNFMWYDHKGIHADLVRVDPASGRRWFFLRYMYQAYDNSSPDLRNRTYKVFHHLYNQNGNRFVTNGGETDLKPGETKKLLYPHHRGLMFGFNRISYGAGMQADTWHCGKGEHQSHVKFLNVEEGKVLGRHRALIDWLGRKNDRFAQEERELTVYDVKGGTLVEFASRLRSTQGSVKLDGDPQHAGFQFRAANEVADKSADKTYYLRPDGKGDLGKTRNWPQVQTHVDLPWNAMSFVLDDKRYTAAYLDHPHNPRPSRHSERDYGRFGCYFVSAVTPDRPLLVNYRLWLQQGEMTVPQVQALSRNFASPPRVTATDN